MHSVLRWAVAAVAGLAIGSACAEPYAHIAAPWYAVAARLLAHGHPWTVTDVDVGPGKSGSGTVVRLKGEVRKYAWDSVPAGTVISRVQVGEAVETPVVFWTLLLVWPGRSWRQRLLLVAAGLPVFLLLESLLTPWQLLQPLGRASAIIAGCESCVSQGDLWSRFLEAGGRFVVEAFFALVVIALTGRWRARTEAAPVPPAVRP